MYFSKLVFTPNQEGQIIKGLDLKNPYTYHKWIWRLFKDSTPNKTEADFLFRVDSFINTPVIQLLSKREPIDSFQHWSVTTSNFKCGYKKNDLIQFSLRANPVVCRKSDDGKHRKHDVLMDSKRNHASADSDYDNMYEAAKKWLSSRANSHGFELITDTLQINNYRQLKFYKTGSTKENNPIKISTLDYQGIAKVSDELFNKLLINGLGPSKRFGCSLFLVKPLV